MYNCVSVYVQEVFGNMHTELLVIGTTWEWEWWGGRDKRKEKRALPWPVMAQLVGCHPAFNSRLGTCLGCGLGVYKRQPIDVSLPVFLPPFYSL